MNGIFALGEYAPGELPPDLVSVSALATLYAASRGYAPKPYDAAPGRYYEGRMLTSITLEASIPAGQGGKAAQAQGELRLWNGDGYLDGALLTHAIDGRDVRLSLAPADGLADVDPWDCGDGVGPAGIEIDLGDGAGPAPIECDIGADP